MKSYTAIGPLEKRAGHCPTYLAWIVIDEARDYFRKPIPESYADELARRAEGVFAAQPFWRRKYGGAQGREYLLASLRHWLASVLAREKPALFRALPDSFKMGGPLPRQPAPDVEPGRKNAAKARPGQRMTHGRELMAF